MKTGTAIAQQLVGIDAIQYFLEFIIDESGSTERTEYIAQGYYWCTSASFLAPYTTCGDGVPSNGRPAVTTDN